MGAQCSASFPRTRESIFTNNATAVERKWIPACAE
jgi:hypothetical protein